MNKLQSRPHISLTENFDFIVQKEIDKKIQKSVTKLLDFIDKKHVEVEY